MPRPLDGAVGERLELAPQSAEFQERYERATEFWKLERGQVYSEPGDESWEAFDRGDWEESLRLLEDRRADFADRQRQNDARGMMSRRVRIVSLPPSPYLHWELCLLRIRDEFEHHTRVVLDRDVAGLEDHGPLPDLNTLDTDVMYEIVYDGNGLPDHAIRYTDTALVRRCRDFIVSLYESSEPISDFFQREIAPLPPPRPDRQAAPCDYAGKTGRQRSLRT
ncbi:MAG: hypothetical protein J2P25_07830 [Nocardiopsaceae bacterium]|nr:hypothetical protein [Nocardiopsaceae bacterium]